MPITLETDTNPSAADVGVTRRVRSAGFMLLVLLPIPVTLLGVALATAGGWLGIGLVVALQASMVATLILTADHPLPGRHGSPAIAVQTQPVDGSETNDADQPWDDPETL